MVNKPFSESCEQNKEAILAIIQPHLRQAQRVLEIGSGTGQHAVYFAHQLPHLTWQTTDVAQYIPGIQLWIDEAALSNTPSAIALDVSTSTQVFENIDAVFSANTVHIMSWPVVEKCFAYIGDQLQPNGVFCLYGPFNYQGEYTSESNRQFDAWLKARDSASGIKDFDAVNTLAQSHQLQLTNDHEMPANNRLLVWRKGDA